MHKITSYADGASMSRKFAPDLVTSDAHAQSKVMKSYYSVHEPNAGGAGKKPPVYSAHTGLGEDEPRFGDHHPKKSVHELDVNAPIKSPPLPGKNEPYKKSLNHPDVQRKLREQEQNNRRISEFFAKPSPRKDLTKDSPKAKTWDDKKKK